MADFVSFNEKINGINDNITEEMAVDFLKNDFLFYTSHRTFDKGKAINMFINQLREYVAINNYEEQLLQEFLQNQAYIKKEKYQFNRFKWDYRIFLDKDLTEVLNRVFDINKVNYCLSNLRQRNYFRHQCYLVVYRKMGQYDAYERDSQVYYYIYPDTNIDK